MNKPRKVTMVHKSKKAKESNYIFIENLNKLKDINCLKSVTKFSCKVDTRMEEEDVALFLGTPYSSYFPEIGAAKVLLGR